MSDLTKRLAEALAVCDAATDGPWEADTYMTKPRRVIDIKSGGLKTEPSKLYGSLSIIPSDGVYGEFDGHDAEFIATARTGYPAALRALQAVLDTVEHYPVPSKYDDPTGDIGGAVEAFGRAVEAAITKHLGATP